MASSKTWGTDSRTRRREAARRLLAGQASIVAMPEDEPVAGSVADVQARVDDVLWTRFVLLHPFSWMAFIEWWLARRWVEPRDARRVRAEQRA